MGGWAPLGYDIHARKLLVNEAEAVQVRRIFAGFVEMESGTKLVQALRAEEVTLPQLMQGVAVEWGGQNRLFANCTAAAVAG